MEETKGEIDQKNQEKGEAGPNLKKEVTSIKKKEKGKAKQMDKFFELAASFVDKSYVEMAFENFNSREKMIQSLLSHRTLPEVPWDDSLIEHFLGVLASMDTNNFIGKIGVGERESRIVSNIVKKRHFYMGHGIGRSGEISATQPKAAGSSLMLKLTQALAQDALAVCGVQFIEDVLVLPLATGMALTLVLLTFKAKRPNAKYVIWPRLDQKTCLKCIVAANLTPVIIENKPCDYDELVLSTDFEALQKKVEELGPENILCILSVTSCFAPRAPDCLEEMAALCKAKGIPHLVNNAYGLQCTKMTALVNRATKTGRVDAVVQSTDKNFMVPVGGSIVFSSSKDFLKSVSSNYPGRASGAPVLDLLITFLSIGKSGLVSILKKRKELFDYTVKKLSDFAKRKSEKFIQMKGNSISLAITIKELDQGTAFGSQLYKRRIMGSRVVAESKGKMVSGFSFDNYGSHSNHGKGLPYVTVACAVGMTQEDVDKFIEKMEKIYEKRQAQKQKE